MNDYFVVLVGLVVLFVACFGFIGGVVVLLKLLNALAETSVNAYKLRRSSENKRQRRADRSRFYG